MLQLLQYVVVLGGLVNLLGALSYIKDTVRAGTKPNRITWLLWAIAPFIATAAALSRGAGWAALPVFMAGFGPLLVFVSSFINKHYWRLGVTDYLCGASSVLALVLWWLTNNPAFAIIFAIVSDGLAALPTLIKSYTHPETESGIAYSTGLFNALTSFLAIRVWTFTAYAFPLYLVVANSALLFVFYRKKMKH
jgi:hypothetical protein